MSKWIKFSNRLPRQNKQIDIWYNDSRSCKLALIKDKVVFLNLSTFSIALTDPNLTHWRYAPQNPKS